MNTILKIRLKQMKETQKDIVHQSTTYRNKNLYGSRAHQNRQKKRERHLRIN